VSVDANDQEVSAMICLLFLALQLPACDPERMSLAQLDAAFAAGKAEAPPLGSYRGRVIYLDKQLPRIRALGMNAAWKGKIFRPDGSFINRWALHNAVEAQSTIAPSWTDGKGAVIVDYPDNAPVFGGTRDEIREIAPGVWLGRFYDAGCCPKFKGYFVLRAECGCK
jgi:hypothetical protein